LINNKNSAFNTFQQYYVSTIIAHPLQTIPCPKGSEASLRIQELDNTRQSLKQFAYVLEFLVTVKLTLNIVCLLNAQETFDHIYRRSICCYSMHI